MKSQKNETTQRYLLLFKLDAKNLYERIKSRKADYVEVFALRRTREHFKEVFASRYDKATVRDLSHCSTETISAMDQFYGLVDELRWYLYCTEDMPNTVEDNVHRKVIKLGKLHAMLDLYLDAELGIDQADEQAMNDIAFDEGSEKLSFDEAATSDFFREASTDEMMFTSQKEEEEGT